MIMIQIEIESHNEGKKIVCDIRRKVFDTDATKVELVVAQAIHDTVQKVIELNKPTEGGAK